MLARIFSKIILLCVLVHCINPLFAQVTFNSDEEFQKARTLAFSSKDKRPEARILLRKILAVKPTYTDVQTLLARTYSWDGKYDSARKELEEALFYEPKNEDATNALIDVELWSDNYQAALDLSNKALKEINPRSEDFLLKKTRAQSNLKSYKEAYATLQELLKINPKNAKALSLAGTLKKEVRTSSMGVTYYYDRFSTTFTPWNQASVFYSHKTKFLGKVIGRVNYANRFNEPGLQYEIDMYPNLTKNMYSYFNFGYSNDDIFPTYRFGFSLYRDLPNSFESEIGLRYLKFTTATVIYTVSLGKYVSNFWFNVRGNYVPDNTGSSWSVSLISRYYLSDADNYLSLSLGTGFAPDQFANNINPLSSSYVSSNKARLEFQHRLGSRYLFNTGIGYARDEYVKDSYRENFNFNVGLEIFF